MLTRRLFLGALLAPVLASAESPRVSFVRPPAIVTDQFRIPIYIRVPIHEENRTLAIAAFDGEFRVQYAERDLWSERRKTIWDVAWQLPAGNLLLIAVVWDSTKEIARATHPISVVAWG